MLVARVSRADRSMKNLRRISRWLAAPLGVLLSVEVTPANTSDQAGARRLLIGLKPLQPRLELIWADGS